MSQQSRSGGDHGGLALPELQLDELLTELQSRIEAARAVRDRVQALLEAVVAIGGELALQTVLRRITEVATGLVDARYGALGVIGEERERLVEFVAVGVSEQDIAAIGQWPRGHGILGLLIRDPRPLRLRDLVGHPGSSGFPPNHPRMRSFLGVPIRVRDEVFGNLYLAEKEGGGEFTEEDEVVLTALATAAGVAIENARLYEETRQRERWLEGAAEISTALLSGTAPHEVIAMIARRARQIAGADLATVTLVDGTGREFRVEAADGRDAERLEGARVARDHSVAGAVYAGGASLRLQETAHEETAQEGNAYEETAQEGNAPTRIGDGPLLVVRLGGGASARGVISVANAPGGAVFGEATRRLLEAFAGQAAVALELADRRRDTERLALLEDRDRIAKDLHDTVIQRLFATAMTLMSAIKITELPEAAARMQRAVDDLDGTIRQIRSSIFALQATADEESLRARVRTVVDATAAHLGFTPSIRLDGLLDTSVDEETAEHLLAVVREAFSNIVRHARATEALLAIEVRDDLTVRVEDDGVGIAADVHRSGLRNMADRAKDLGGTFSAGPRPGGGTALCWRVPLASD